MDALVFVGAGIGDHGGDAAPTFWAPATAEGRFLSETTILPRYSAIGRAALGMSPIAFGL